MAESQRANGPRTCTICRSPPTPMEKRPRPRPVRVRCRFSPPPRIHRINPIIPRNKFVPWDDRIDPIDPTDPVVVGATGGQCLFIPHRHLPGIGMALLPSGRHASRVVARVEVGGRHDAAARITAGEAAPQLQPHLIVEAGSVELCRAPFLDTHSFHSRDCTRTMSE
eukprot:gene4217-biopygen21905